MYKIIFRIIIYKDNILTLYLYWNIILIERGDKHGTNINNFRIDEKTKKKWKKFVMN